MATFAGYSSASMAQLRKQMEQLLKPCSFLQEAGQTCVSVIFREFEESLALARLYVSCRYKQLPAADQGFVNGLVDSKSLKTLLDENTIVLSLLGTRGKKRSWDDRRESSGHLGIPLLSSSFVESIPMVASLMKDMGLGLEWIDQRDSSILVKTLGRLARVFYVRDASSTVDGQRRKIVPAQDFVASNGIKTVFGLGGGYMDGTFVAIILFTRERLEKEQVENMMPLVNAFKTSTMELVSGKRLFEK